MEHRLGIAALAGQLLRLFHVVVNTWEGLEETIDEQLCLVACDVETLGKSERGDAIDDAEVGTLRLRALVAADVVDIFLIDRGSGGGMQVLAFAEHFLHRLVARKVSHHAQFNLTIVC